MDSSGKCRASTSMSKIKYAEWIRLDAAAMLHIDVQLADCGKLLPFLRANKLHFECTELETLGEQVTFWPGTTVDQVHAALARFDELNR
jgi:hypothetical protein